MKATQSKNERSLKLHLPQEHTKAPTGIIRACRGFIWVRFELYARATP